MNHLNRTRGSIVALAASGLMVASASPSLAWSDYQSNAFCTVYVTSSTAYDYAYTYEVVGNCARVGVRHQVNSSWWTSWKDGNSYAQSPTTRELTSSEHRMTNY